MCKMPENDPQAMLGVFLRDGKGSGKKWWRVMCETKIASICVG